jgi:hypothetical protein
LHSDLTLPDSKQLPGALLSASILLRIPNFQLPAGGRIKKISKSVPNSALLLKKNFRKSIPSTAYPFPNSPEITPTGMPTL